jgi:nitrite reductase/ring-hydroxylating ferredoxin subunit
MSNWLLTDSILDPVNKLPVIPSRLIHDERRKLTYPHAITNTWYHFCNIEELPIGKVLEIKALNQVFVLWRKKDGTPVAQDAFCLHLGANLAVGGKVVDDCLECPFHRWKFDNEGSITCIPYIKDKNYKLPDKKLKTYPCVDWCGLVCVYFHADDEPPAFQLPDFIASSLTEDKWASHLQWNIGFKALSPIDWVDQAGDHAHFHTLHNEFLIPWTKIPLPKWFLSLFPLGICHRLTTYRGDDREWKQLTDKRSPSRKGHIANEEESGGQYCVDKHLIFFQDEAGLTWKVIV